MHFPSHPVEEIRKVLWLWAMEGTNYREMGEALAVPV